MKEKIGAGDVSKEIAEARAEGGGGMRRGGM
jgi:hypothetical protein